MSRSSPVWRRRSLEPHHSDPSLPEINSIDKVSSAKSGHCGLENPWAGKEDLRVFLFLHVFVTFIWWGAIIQLTFGTTASRKFIKRSPSPFLPTPTVTPSCRGRRASEEWMYHSNITCLLFSPSWWEVRQVRECRSLGRTEPRRRRCLSKSKTSPGACSCLRSDTTPWKSRGRVYLHLVLGNRYRSTCSYGE